MIAVAQASLPMSTTAIDLEATDEPVNERAQRILGIGDRFQGLHRIGGGGSAEIYRAWDEERNQRVAIKRLGSFHKNRQQDKEMFVQEFEVLQGLDHDSIPQVFDYFPAKMFKPHFTMEFMRGMTLCRVLHGIRMEVAGVDELFPLLRMLEMVESVADSLIDVHQREIVHRDIKPENVMIVDDGRTCLLDWGTALLPNQNDVACDEGVDTTNQRRQTTIIGSPLYMPPEQTYPAAEVDHRADIFSLGAVLYDCLALTTLNPGQSLGEAIDFTRSGIYPSPASITLRPEIPACLDELCMAAIHPNREERIQTMTEFSDELHHCLELIA